jgi:hypothetical protein
MASFMRLHAFGWLVAGLAVCNGGCIQTHTTSEVTGVTWPEALAHEMLDPDTARLALKKAIADWNDSSATPVLLREQESLADPRNLRRLARLKGPFTPPLIIATPRPGQVEVQATPPPRRGPASWDDSGPSVLCGEWFLDVGAHKWSLTPGDGRVYFGDFCRKPDGQWIARILGSKPFTSEIR